MDITQPDARYLPPADLAGRHYENMIRDRDTALEFLRSTDCKLRLAAILTCESRWACGPTREFFEACAGIVSWDIDESFHISAIGVLGRVFSATKSAEVSELLAKVAMHPGNAVEVRQAAYWALRHVQFGTADRSFNDFMKGTVSVVKSILRSYPGRLQDEGLVRDRLLPPGRFPDDFWDTSDDIDWSWVAKFCGSGIPFVRTGSGFKY